MPTICSAAFIIGTNICGLSTSQTSLQLKGPQFQSVSLDTQHPMVVIWANTPPIPEVKTMEIPKEKREFQLNPKQLNPKISIDSIDSIEKEKSSAFHVDIPSIQRSEHPSKFLIKNTNN